MSSTEEGQQRRPGTHGGPRGSARGRLLDAAEQLFATDGFAATTTRSIAERAGTSTGMVFYHFPSKSALLETLLAERSPQADLAELIDDHAGDPRGLLRALADAVSRTVEHRGEVLRIMLRAEDPAHGEMFRRYLDTTTAALGAQLQADLSGTGMTGSQAEAIARSFLATLLVTLLLAPVEDPDRLIDDTIDALLRDVARPS